MKIIPILAVILIITPLAMLGVYALTPWIPNKPEAATIFGLILSFLSYVLFAFISLGDSK